MHGRLQGIAEAVVLNMDGGTRIPTMLPITEYVWGPDRLLAKIDKTTNKSYYYLYNGHGDVVQVVDTSGAVKNTYDYDVWGNFLKKEEAIENHFTYFGQTYDDTTGLYYLRARYYDPTTGRFTQQDSAEDGYNWYIYGNNNPVMYVDCSGNSAVAISAGSALLAKAAPYIVAGLATVGTLMFAEHHKKGTTNPSNLPKHQKGQKRKQTDKFGGEKGDSRRTPRKDKKK